MAYQCDECGKTLASEGGLEIHMEGHARPPKPDASAVSAAVLPVYAMPASSPGPPKTEPHELVIMGLALAAALVFFVGLAAAINPSMIRKHDRTTVAATADAHKVAIPDGTPTTILADVDKQRVGSLVLQQADYGPGWQLDGDGISGSDGDSSDSSTGGDLDSCSAALSDAGHETNADASGPDVVKGSLKASTSAALYPNAADAAADFATLNDPNALPCLKSAMKKSIVDGGLPASSVAVGGERFSIASGTAQNIGLRIITTVHGPGGSKTFYLDMILLRHDRAAAFLLMFAEDSRVPAAVEQALVGRLAQRLAGAEGVPA